MRGIVRKRNFVKWESTRQQLAYIVLRNTSRVSNDINAIFAEERRGQLSFYKDIKFRLENLKVGLRNFVSETMVHLPSLRPGLAEDLSKVTVRVSNLEVSVHMLSQYVEQIEQEIHPYDCDSNHCEAPGYSFIEPSIFFPKINKKNVARHKDCVELERINLMLSSTGDPSIENYIFQTLTNCIERYCALVNEVVPLVEEYSLEWDGDSFSEMTHRGSERRDNAKHSYATILKDRDRLVNVHCTMLDTGFYLALCDANFSKKSTDH